MSQAPDTPAHDPGARLLAAVRQHWKLLMAQALLMIALGALAIAIPNLATLAVDFYIGWFFLISGVAALVMAFSIQQSRTFVWTVITGVLLTLTGGFLVARPVAGVVALTIALTALFLAEGIGQIVASFPYRRMSSAVGNSMLFSGIVDLVMAAIVLANWPQSATYVLGILAGVNLISSGAALASLAMAGRNMNAQAALPPRA